MDETLESLRSTGTEADSQDPESELAAPARGNVPAAPEPDWRSGLPDDLQRFAAHLETPSDAVRMAAGLRQKLSRAIFPPSEESSEDEVAVFRRKIGVPESPDAYNVSPPPELAPILAADPKNNLAARDFAEKMHAAGAPVAAVQAAADWYYERLADQTAEFARQRDAQIREAEENLLKEWGPDYERNLEYARRSAQSFGGDALIECLEQAGIGNDPVVFRALYRIGRELGEDEIFSDSHHGDHRQKLEARAAELRGRGDRWTNDGVDRELRDIMSELHGTQLISTTNKKTQDQ